MHEVTIEVKAISDLGAIDPFTLSLFHKECGRVTLRRTFIQPPTFWELTCARCNKRWTITENGLQAILFTSIDRAKTRDLGAHVVGESQRLAVAPWSGTNY